ncbi:MAG: DUF1028 domain-containing protein [Bacteroidota bacterium]|jgi:uncharacterized Ntn-hydrolase superfamily protein
MKHIILSISFGLLIHLQTTAQDTFSIVAVDTVTGEVGSAGASCVDLILFFPNYATDFLGDLIPGVGAVNTQASYNTTNQSNARARMLAGDTPQQIISWLQANDAQGNGGSNRQYGIAALNNGSALTAGFTGSNTLNYKNHIAGPNYCIQGNILLGQSVLDSMEARFNAAQGDLSCKLMAALQGANVVGADTRCASNGTSSLFAFLKVAQPGDSIGQPSFLISVKTPGGAGIEPIDSLQILFDAQKSCTTTGLQAIPQTSWSVYPNPAGDYVIVAGDASGLTRAAFRVLDIEGRLVLEGLLHSDTNRIDLSTLKPGVYTLDLPGNVHKRVVRRSF